MINKEFWDQINRFRAVDAAQLMVGVEPGCSTTALPGSAQLVLRKMEASFIEACGGMRIFLESEYGSKGEDEIFIDDEYPWLISQEMFSHYDQCMDAKSKTSFESYRRHALLWLDTNLESFHHQQFLRGHIHDWIEDLGMPSAYKFDPEESAPSIDRRAEVKRVVDEVGGNKSEAGRILGISRQRVAQLLREQPSDRKSLQIKAQGPFAGLSS